MRPCFKLNGSLRGLAERQVMAALVGRICGSLNFYAGQQLRPLRLGGHESLSLLLLSILWAMLLPVLLR